MSIWSSDGLGTCLTCTILVLKPWPLQIGQLLPPEWRSVHTPLSSRAKKACLTGRSRGTAHMDCVCHPCCRQTSAKPAGTEAGSRGWNAPTTEAVPACLMSTCAADAIAMCLQSYGALLDALSSHCGRWLEIAEPLAGETVARLMVGRRCGEEDVMLAPRRADPSLRFTLALHEVR